MFTESLIAGAPVAPREESELPNGLFFLRASNLKMMRLQLALERQDRRAALMAVDELLDLDRTIERHLALVSERFSAGPHLRDLDRDRAAVDQEKLALAAQIISRRNASIEPEYSDHRPPVSIDTAHNPSPATYSPEAVNDWTAYQDEELPDASHASNRALWVIAIMALLACAAAVAAYLLGYIHSNSLSLL